MIWMLRVLITVGISLGVYYIGGWMGATEWWWPVLAGVIGGLLSVGFLRSVGLLD